MDTYTLLVEKVDRHVKHYRDDLIKHDKAALETYPGTPFLHWTRDTGTCLVFLHAADHESWPPRDKQVPYLFGHAGRVHIVEQTVEQAKYWAHPSLDGTVKACHYFDGTKLHEITVAKAVDIARDYVRKVEREWGQYV